MWGPITAVRLSFLAGRPAASLAGDGGNQPKPESCENHSEFPKKQAMKENIMPQNHSQIPKKPDKQVLRDKKGHS
jgi:hypothetical protein